MAYTLPGHFASRIRAIFGEQGQAWLEDLPALLDDCARRWELTLQPPFELSYNYVAPAVRADGSLVVLKVGPPNPELLCEQVALGLYGGRGCAALLDADPTRGITLLEHVWPGERLSALEDDERATRLAAEVIGQLWRPLPPEHPFPSAAGWMRGLARQRERCGGGSGPLPERLLDQAERLAAELLGSAGAPVLLHGDLHHDNILSARRAPWLAIDPKGLAGELAYEVGALLRNPLPALLERPDPAATLARRVAIFSEMLGLERQRVAAWGMAQAVLSACWSIEDEGRGWEEATACAELLSGMC
jgi:streptomycin 6-kinase